MTRKTILLFWVVITATLTIACYAILPSITIPSTEINSCSVNDSGCISDKAIQDARDEIQRTEQMCPVAKVLPYGGPFDGVPFFIHRPRPDRTILVEIDSTVDFEAAKEAALQWIQDQGYDPKNLGCDLQFRVAPFSQ